MYDPVPRMTAREALEHRWFAEEPLPSAKCVFFGYFSIVLFIHYRFFPPVLTPVFHLSVIFHSQPQ